MHIYYVYIDTSISVIDNCHVSLETCPTTFGNLQIYHYMNLVHQIERDCYHLGCVAKVALVIWKITSDRLIFECSK